MMASLQLQKVKEFLNCAICYDTFKDPCTLACQHTFCRHCITNYLSHKPEAVGSKVILCPSCRQNTRVPSPAQPMERWAEQIKPNIIIVGLLDTSQGCQAGERCCSVCDHLGETTPATTWCQECEMNLCERCTKAHHLNVGSRDHELCQLSEDVKIKKKHKLYCEEHEKKLVEFHCRDCGKPACQSCSVLHHRMCNSVVTIESMKEEMLSELEDVRGVISQQLDKTSLAVDSIKTKLVEVSHQKETIKMKIRQASQSAMDIIRDQENKLVEKLELASRTQMGHLRAERLRQEGELQAGRQHCEEIDQAVSEDSAVRMYQLYRTCQSMLPDPSADQTKRRGIEDITFVEDAEKKSQTLGQLELGDIRVLHQTESGTDVKTWNDVDIDLLSSPILCDNIDTKCKDNVASPDIIDMTVMNVDDIPIVVVTDWSSDSVRAFYKVNNQQECSMITLDRRPSGLTHLDKQVMVTVLGSREIVTLDVTPELVHSSSMTTQKLYMSLAAINSSYLAAGCSKPTPCVDILNMTGHVVMSISTFDSKPLFMKPVYLCMCQGNIMVSDWENRSVTCISPTGEVLWSFSPSDKSKLKRIYGITGTSTGGVLLADRDSHKVVLVNKEGEEVRDIITEMDGISQPRGISFDEKRGCVYVSEDNGTGIKEFVFGVNI